MAAICEGNPIIGASRDTNINKTMRDINNPAASATAQSEIWVMCDWIGANLTKENQEFNHLPGGCNVLYLDGHVEFLKYPTYWPVNPAAAVIFSS